MKLPNIIKLGNRGESVRWVQRKLIENGAVIVIDGVFGNKTLEAVKKFQRSKKIVVDGIVGVQTQSYLRKVKAPSNKKSPASILPKPKPPKAPSVGERAVKIMEEWVGLVESPRNSNKVPKLTSLGKRVGWTAGIYNMRFAWCNYGVHLALALAGKSPIKASGNWAGHTGMYVPATVAELNRLHKQGKVAKIAKNSAKRGDIVIMFKQGHIGFCAKNVTDKRTMHTVECNTSSSAAGSQSNGGGVYKKVRLLAKDIDAVYRLK